MRALTGEVFRAGKALARVAERFVPSAPDAAVRCIGQGPHESVTLGILGHCTGVTRAGLTAISRSPTSDRRPIEPVLRRSERGFCNCARDEEAPAALTRYPCSLLPFELPRP